MSSVGSLGSMGSMGGVGSMGSMTSVGSVGSVGMDEYQAQYAHHPALHAPQSSLQHGGQQQGQHGGQQQMQDEYDGYELEYGYDDQPQQQQQQQQWLSPSVSSVSTSTAAAPSNAWDSHEQPDHHDQHRGEMELDEDAPLLAQHAALGSNRLPENSTLLTAYVPPPSSVQGSGGGKSKE